MPEELGLNLQRLPRRSDFWTNIVETFGVRALLYLIAFASVVLVARALGPDARGLYAVAASITTLIVQLGNGGLYAANAYHASRHPADVPALVGNTLVASVIIGGIGAVVCWVGLTIWPTISPVHGALLVLAVVWIPLGLAKLLLQYLLLGVQRIRAYNASELLSASAGFLLLASLAITGQFSVETAFATTVVSSLIATVFALVRLQLATGCPPAFSWLLFQRMLPYGLRVYWSALAAFITFRLDLLLVDGFLGNVQAGYYSIVLAMAEVLLLSPVVVGSVLFPRLSAMSTESERERFAMKVAVGVGVFSAATAAVSAVLAAPAVSLLFGDAYLPAAASFLALLPGVVLVSVNTIYMNLFAANGMPVASILPPTIGMLLNFVLDLYLIPSMGIVGASVASSLAYGVMLIASVVVRRLLRTRNSPAGPDHVPPLQNGARM